MNTNNIISLISSIRNKANNFILAELKKIGINNISPSHGYILYTLYKKDGIPMKDITKNINKKKNTVTILIDKLIKEGYVYKEIDIKDKRFSRIFLSEKGQSFKENFMHISEILLEKAFANIHDLEKEKLMELLLKIENNFM